MNKKTASPKLDWILKPSSNEVHWHVWVGALHFRVLKTAGLRCSGVLFDEDADDDVAKRIYKSTVDATKLALERACVKYLQKRRAQDAESLKALGAETTNE